MAPAAIYECSTPVLELANAELEKLRLAEDNQTPIFHGFPPACHAMLTSIEGNNRCIDCGERNPEWAAINYGALMCLHCSGKHRSLGVQVSSVRSVAMDAWSLHDVLGMLEGGNNQLQQFFSRHQLCEATAGDRGTRITPDNVSLMRYRTKAALFYRQQLDAHVCKILSAWPYRGREHSRRQRRNRPLAHTESSTLS